MSYKIIAILGSYRRGGIIHQAVDVILDAAQNNGVNVEKIDLLDADISFCTNCRACMQEGPEETRGKCVISDDMPGILDKLDSADAIILASPINMYSPTALMKRFMERLAPYAYWPWEVPYPKTRKGIKQKKIIIITSSGAPGFIVKLFASNWSKPLRDLARNVWGVKKPKTFHLGNAALSSDQQIDIRQKTKLKKAAALFR
ncbi:MAG TPA: flavodoxin family protein [Spirochaetota bacterium]|nr:flavodoxin family protein [Spirochaetota bacterium]HPI91274.1 flavodoxin family protein [Spirochaetota bacterium]HPR49924.1 flavodoxin family protein [Spirochaetota bacterium]